MGKSMTGYQSKKAAASDEEGMYLVHHTKRKDDDDDAQGYIAQYESALQKEYQRGYDAGKAAQPGQERNFCPRCGKRTQEIHTCTPPQKNT
jgi:hypothetical protein